MSKCKITAVDTKVPYPGFMHVVGSGKNAKRAPRFYLTKDDVLEVDLHANQGYWARRLVKNEVKLVDEKKKKPVVKKETKKE